MRDFYATVGGRHFIDGTIPNLVRQVERCASAVDRLASAAERVALALERGNAPPDAK